VAGVAEARQPALPVWREQPQRIPALGAPRVGDLAALEDQMIDRALGEAPAHGEAGVAGADDDGGDRAHGRALSCLDLSASCPASCRASTSIVQQVRRGWPGRKARSRASSTRYARP